MNPGFDFNQLRVHVVRPVLQHLGLWSASAENLILGTIAQESAGGHYVKQLGKGPAMGIIQMEPATHDDIWKNYLAYKGHIADKIREWNLPGLYDGDDCREMVGNHFYAVAMCRAHYLRVPAALPRANDVRGLAAYWKKYYNTHLGAGTEAEFIKHYQRYVGA